MEKIVGLGLIIWYFNTWVQQYLKHPGYYQPEIIERCIAYWSNYQ